MSLIKNKNNKEVWGLSERIPNRARYRTRIGYASTKKIDKNNFLWMAANKCYIFQDDSTIEKVKYHSKQVFFHGVSYMPDNFRYYTMLRIMQVFDDRPPTIPPRNRRTRTDRVVGL